MYNARLHFHFCGIGGSGMSGIAEILLAMGFRVSGSDLKLSDVTSQLATLGAQIVEGHGADRIPPEASLLVYSSAVAADNPELIEARRRGIPVVRRAEVLAELMRLKYGVAVAGSHGKTTTTSICAAILERGGLDPTVIIGGQLASRGSGSRPGRSEFLVAESDESDRSFLLLRPTVAVVTNIDTEHLSAYASLSDLEHSFESFVESVPFYGLAVLCVDDARVRAIAESYSKRKVTYGFSPQADLQPRILKQHATGTEFEVLRSGNRILRTTLPVLGRHLVLNATAAIAVGLEFEVSPQVMEEAISAFEGVRRRLEVVGERAGVTVMNDYGHHPTEIRATLRAIREGFGEQMRDLHVVFQPHRYSRTRECFADFIEAFADASSVLVSDIYAASEAPLAGVSGELLCEAMAHPHKEFIGPVEAALPRLLERVQEGDVVLCLGAGSVGALPPQVLAALDAWNTSGHGVQAMSAGTEGTAHRMTGSLNGKAA